MQTLFDVCFILEGTYPIDVGGITSWLHDLVGGLAGKKLACARIGCAIPEPSQFAVRPPENMQVYAINEPGGLRSQQIRAWAQVNQKSVPVAKTYHVIGAGLAAALGTEVKRSRNCGLILTEHASYLAELELGAKRLESGRELTMDAEASVRLSFENIARDAYLAADLITALHLRGQDLQRRLGAPALKLRLVRNGVQGQHFKETPPTEPIRLLQLARIHPLKQNHLFLELVRSLQKKRGVRAALLGPENSVPYATYCRQLAEDLPVEFHRAAPRGQWPFTPHFVVLTSRSEAQPLAILEGFAQGVPGIAPAIGDCVEMLSPKEHGSAAGIFFDPRRAETTADKISAVIDDRIAYEKMRREAYQRSQTKYAISDMRAAYQELYRTVAPQEIEVV